MELVLDSVSKLLSNLVLLSAIPFLWWMIGYRKKETFFKWIGLYKPSVVENWWIVLIFGIVHIFFSIFDWTLLMPSSDLAILEQSDVYAANAYTGLAWAAVLPAFIENFLANGLCEELFFRGFLTKRLVSRIGVINGVVAQAVVFGLLHNLLCLAGGVGVSFSYHAVLFMITGTSGFMLGLLNEKILNGSIIPGIVLHGLGNFIVSMRAAFL